MKCYNQGEGVTMIIHCPAQIVNLRCAVNKGFGFMMNSPTKLLDSPCGDRAAVHISQRVASVRLLTVCLGRNDPKQELLHIFLKSDFETCQTLKKKQQFFITQI